MQTTAAPHLNFKGDCLEAFRFYAETLGGRIVFSLTYGEAPGALEAPAGSRDKIAHARLDLGNQFLLGCDALGNHYQTPQGFSVMAAVDEVADAERIFSTLADGGTVCMPFAETFWAHGFGMCTDRFGTPWMVNCAKPVDELPGAARSA
jgi:PhnB protein